MTIYKAGQEWQRTLNENLFLNALVIELRAEIEALHEEIRDMQATADSQEDAEIFDEETYDEIQLPHGI